MTIFTVGFTVLAALLHVYIFVLESFRWNEPSTRRTFGVSEQDAPVLAPMAYNQGFYNLFLALGVVLGLALLVMGDIAGSRAVLLFACGSMIAAGIVLFLHNRAFLRAALIQAVPPLVALVPLLVFG